MSNDRHRTVLRWYERHKNKSIYESLAVIGILIKKLDKTVKKMIQLAEREQS